MKTINNFQTVRGAWRVLHKYENETAVGLPTDEVIFKTDAPYKSKLSSPQY